ncbi:MAG TPA: MoaD/ThiS family protein [Frankiaceae bacterium]|jgi:molybdopterin converting factor small subunit|nr:MoaD/ThiS family protein [Frankiaceae bacterium]
MTSVTVHYWAAAREAAGCVREVLTGVTLADVIAQAGEKHGPDLTRLLGICSFIVGDRPVKREHAADVALQEGLTVEVLPPFAGGSRTSVGSVAASA